MQDQAQENRLARSVLRALFLCVASVVAVLIGASTAQADDAEAGDAKPAPTVQTAPEAAQSDVTTAPVEKSAAAAPAPEAAPAPRLAPVTDPASAATQAAHRSAERLVQDTTQAVRGLGRQVSPVAPATETVATVVEQATGRLDARVTEVARAAQGLVEGPVTTIVDGVLSPVRPPVEDVPGADVQSGSSNPETSTSVQAPRRAERTSAAQHAAPAPVSTSLSTAGPGVDARDLRVDTSPDLPPLGDILELGAFSGALSAGSGAAGGPTPASTLPSGLTAPADVSLGVVADADDERLFALPLTPGWSPD